MKSQTSKQNSSRLIPSKSALKPKLSRIGLWQITVEAIAKSNWWQMFLIVVGSTSSIIYPHVPLVGFAAVWWYSNAAHLTLIPCCDLNFFSSLKMVRCLMVCLLLKFYF